MTRALGNLRWHFGIALLFTGAATGARAQAPTARPWTDPSPHQVRHVPVAPGVRLEVLDWGGSGPALVFLTGMGHTAHVYDDFAPRFRDRFHVYAITRRGFGTSSWPEDGYDAATRARDILTVLDSLRLDRAVLAGHSVAGDELSKIGATYPARVRALVYLDAFDYGPERDAERRAGATQLQPAPVMTAADSASPAAVAAYARRVPQIGGTVPEGEIRELLDFGPDGRLVRDRPRSAAPAKIDAGTEAVDFRRIKVPALGVFFQRPVTGGPLGFAQAAIARFRAGLPHATVIELPGASHYIFLSRPDEVERAMRDFLVQTR